MKNTKIMLAAIATFLGTWFVIAGICCLLSDFSIRECANDNGLIMFMLVFGWIPSVVVTSDLMGE